MEGRRLVILVLAVCVLSAALGAGITLLAKEGPAGADGARGPTGPQGLRGPEGFAAEEEAGEQALNEIDDVRNEVQSVQYYAEELEAYIEELGGQVTQNTRSVSNVCRELNIILC